MPLIARVPKEGANLLKSRKSPVAAAGIQLDSMHLTGTAPKASLLVRGAGSSGIGSQGKRPDSNVAAPAKRPSSDGAASLAGKERIRKPAETDGSKACRAPESVPPAAKTRKETPRASRPPSPTGDDDAPLSQPSKKPEASKPPSPVEDDDDIPLSQKAKSLAVKELASKAGGRKGTPLPQKVKKLDAKKRASQAGDEEDIPLSQKAKRLAAKELAGKAGDEEESQDSNWWEEYQAQDSTIKWTTLEHQGVCFPPEYIPHGIPLIYAGKEIVLEPEAEEVAGFFGALIQTDHAQNDIFVKNFFDDFQQILRDSKSRHAGLIKEFSKCDFSLMHQHFERLKEKRKIMPKDEKEKIKAEKAALIDMYGTALVDGKKERIANFMVEPPGLFRGRGKHPKAGKLKQRVRPEQITINIGKEARVPVPPPGHRWGTVQHDNLVTWMATWVENINRAQKYVFLAPESSMKGRSDLQKFEKARKLKDHVKHIRRVNAEELRSKEMLVRQRATALWLIDHLALRAGNEKGDDEADTVGCCSLRCEHVQLVEPCTIVFDFLGKDSIRYYNEVPVDPIIFKNIGIFMRAPKSATDLIFDRLTTSDLNKYLNGLMPGLTAKVFRTYNASHTFQKELAKTPADGDVAEKVLAYNRANREVAILCNHQKSVSKTHGQSMENMRRKVSHIKYQRHLVKQDLKQLLGKELRKELPEALEPESDLDEELMDSLQTELDQKEQERKTKKLKEQGARDADIAADLAASPAKKARSLSKEPLLRKYAALTQRLGATKVQMIDKDENKTTSLGTSKTNYIDPRITVAWCASHEVPVEKLFTQTLRKKFQWAMSVPKAWKF